MVAVAVPRSRRADPAVLDPDQLDATSQQQRLSLAASESLARAVHSGAPSAFRAAAERRGRNRMRPVMPPWRLVTNAGATVNSAFALDNSNVRSHTGVAR